MKKDFLIRKSLLSFTRHCLEECFSELDLVEIEPSQKDCWKCEQILNVIKFDTSVRLIEQKEASIRVRKTHDHVTQPPSMCYLSVWRRRQ